MQKLINLTARTSMLHETLSRYVEIFDHLLSFHEPKSDTSILHTEKMSGLEFMLCKQKETSKQMQADTAKPSGGQPVIESGNLDDWDKGEGDSGDHATKNVTPFERMQHCRDALEYLDSCGWNRSYHQRLFHEDFLVSCIHGSSDSSPYDLGSVLCSPLSLVSNFSLSAFKNSKSFSLVLSDIG